MKTPQTQAGAALKAARKSVGAGGIEQQALAAAAGISKTTACLIERGHVKPSRPVATMLCWALMRLGADPKLVSDFSREAGAVVALEAPMGMAMAALDGVKNGAA